MRITDFSTLSIHEVECRLTCARFSEWWEEDFFIGGGGFWFWFLSFRPGSGGGSSIRPAWTRSCSATFIVFVTWF